MENKLTVSEIAQIKIQCLQLAKKDYTDKHGKIILKTTSQIVEDAKLIESYVLNQNSNKL